jgi:dTDP-4-amino-4,6-dideoxygalactose transaminase
VHYAGVSCEMDKILEIAKKYNLFVIEDAAQALMSSYKGMPLGSIGNFGAFSFHETKNYSMGEGGALLIKDPKFADHAEIIREKGTNRCQFHRGEIDKYTWVDLGSSYLPSELNAAYLYAQIENPNLILDDRLKSFNLYEQCLESLSKQGVLELPYVPKECKHNAHMFYIKTKDKTTRDKLIQWLSSFGILAVFHYVPLHSAPAGKIYGEFIGEDKFTTSESDKLLRLPMFYGLKPEEIYFVCEKIHEFFKS